MSWFNHSEEVFSLSPIRTGECFSGVSVKASPSCASSLIVCLFVETCSCYMFHSSGNAWNINRKACQDTGGDLVSMETDDEWELVKQFTQHRTTDNKDSDEWHIGLEKDNGTGKWTWVNGKPLNIKRWQPDKPDNTAYESVAVIAKNYPYYTYGLFNNVRPESNGGYICEVKTGESHSFLTDQMANYRCFSAIKPISENDRFFFYGPREEPFAGRRLHKQINKMFSNLNF